MNYDVTELVGDCVNSAEERKRKAEEINRDSAKIHLPGRLAASLRAPPCASDVRRLQLPGHAAGTAHVQVPPPSSSSAAQLPSGRRTRSRWRSPGGSGGPSRAVRALRPPRPARQFPAALRGSAGGSGRGLGARLGVAASPAQRARRPGRGRKECGGGRAGLGEPWRERMLGSWSGLCFFCVFPAGGRSSSVSVGSVGFCQGFFTVREGERSLLRVVVSRRAWECSSGDCPGIPSFSEYFLSKCIKGLRRQEELKKGK